MTKSMHIRAVDWALNKGYVMSVTDYCCDEDEWDIEHSSDAAAILDAINGTDLPNVFVFNVDGNLVVTFSVIDEGNPGETINDYTIAREGALMYQENQEFDQWFSDACGDY